MSNESKPELPRTQEVAFLATEQRSVEELAGTILLDRYRLLDLLGEGGASVVYRAEHTIMHKPLAVKILRPEHVARPDLVRRFLEEARTVARLRHENIVDIVDIGRTESGVVFCVMEWLDGEDLSRTIERDGRMDWARVQRIALQVCRALVAAHRAGIVHRDVKPQNCFRIRRGRDRDFIKLLDFGIAKEMASGQRLTATGVVMGTAGYMPPEQARGETVDERADVYAVGALLFELLSGRPAFEGNNYLDVLVAQLSQPPPRLSAFVTDLPSGLHEIVTRALARNADERWPTMTDLATAIMHVDRAAPIASVRPVEAGTPPTSSTPIDVREGEERRSWVHPVSATHRRLAAVALVGLGVVGVVTAVAYGTTSDDPAVVEVPLLLPETTGPRTPADDRAPVAVAEDPTEPASTPEAPSARPASSPAAAHGAPQEHAELERAAEVRRRADRRASAPKPSKSSAVARSSTGPSRVQIERRLQSACAGEVGFEAKTITIDLQPDAPAKVLVTPPSAPLKQCVARHVATLSLPRDSARLTVRLTPRGTP